MLGWIFIAFVLSLIGYAVWNAPSPQDESLRAQESDTDAVD
jgi:hypothetical protein